MSRKGGARRVKPVEERSHRLLQLDVEPQRTDRDRATTAGNLEILWFPNMT
jgi:hypothetical protein